MTLDPRYIEGTPEYIAYQPVLLAEFARQDRIKAAMIARLEEQDRANIQRQIEWRAEVTRKAELEAQQQKPVRHYPLLSMQAVKRKGARGGYRFWLLARALDTMGAGMIARGDLFAYALLLGLSQLQIDRWMTEARNNDLLTDVQQAQSKGGQWMIIIASLAKAAHALRCENVGTRQAFIPGADLIGAGWRARVQASYEQLHMQKPITRERLQKITNTSASTQRARDLQSGVKRVRSYAKSDIPNDHLQGMKDYSSHKGLFAGRDGFIKWRLPNTYVIDWDGYTTGARGRARKANKQLKGLWNSEGLLFMQQALTSDNEPNETPKGYRLFNATDKQFKTTRRKLYDLQPTAGDVYAFPKKTRRGVLMWEHANAADYVKKGDD